MDLDFFQYVDHDSLAGIDLSIPLINDRWRNFPNGAVDTPKPPRGQLAGVDIAYFLEGVAERMYASSYPHNKSGSNWVYTTKPEDCRMTMPKNARLDGLPIIYAVQDLKQIADRQSLNINEPDPYSGFLHASNHMTVKLKTLSQGLTRGLFINHYEDVSVDNGRATRTILHSPAASTSDSALRPLWHQFLNLSDDNRYASSSKYFKVDANAPWLHFEKFPSAIEINELLNALLLTRTIIRPAVGSNYFSPSSRAVTISRSGSNLDGAVRNDYLSDSLNESSFIRIPGYLYERKEVGGRKGTDDTYRWNWARASYQKSDYDALMTIKMIPKSATWVRFNFVSRFTARANRVARLKTDKYSVRNYNREYDYLAWGLYEYRDGFDKGELEFTPRYPYYDNYDAEMRSRYNAASPYLASDEAYILYCDLEESCRVEQVIVEIGLERVSGSVMIVNP